MNAVCEDECEDWASRRSSLLTHSDENDEA